MYFDRKNSNWLRDLKNAQRIVADRKSAQPIGKGSLVSYKTFSEVSYDYSFNIDNSNPLREFRLTFTHDKSVNGALLSLQVFTALLPDVMVNAIPYFVGVMPGALVRWKKDIDLSDGTKTVWSIIVAKGSPGDSNFDVYFKFFIDGTDTGSWSIVAL